MVYAPQCYLNFYDTTETKVENLRRTCQKTSRCAANSTFYSIVSLETLIAPAVVSHHESSRQCTTLRRAESAPFVYVKLAYLSKVAYNSVPIFEPRNNTNIRYKMVSPTRPSSLPPSLPLILFLSYLPRSYYRAYYALTSVYKSL